jgi:hypothetical protein
MRRRYTLLGAVAVLLVFGIGGCDAPEAAKELIQAKHVELYVFLQRMNNPDPAQRPTQQQMADVITAFAKDTESLDILVNNWKPDSGMSQVDLNGKVSKAEQKLHHEAARALAEKQ